MSSHKEHEANLLNEFRARKPHFEDNLKRYFFYFPAFDIYQQFAGLFDMGPNGTAIKQNIINEWRRFFIVHDNLLEIDSPVFTPHPVLKASGHVDRFTDLMVEDTVTGEPFRADSLLEDFCEERLLSGDIPVSSPEAQKLAEYKNCAEEYSPEEIDAIFKELGVLSPSKNPLSPAFYYNLMFASSMGRGTAETKGFLRPELAQGMFVNFRKMYEANYQRLPMAIAQVGQAFRNEISPRNGLLRVREFTLAEIEHFMDYDEKEEFKHKGYAAVKDTQLTMWSADMQEKDEPAETVTIDEALKSGLVNHETHAYYLARVQQFLERLGVKKEFIRFRQHLPGQLAHYAADCWDADIFCSQGWTECVGIADRSAFDLGAHTKATGAKLDARHSFSEVVEVERSHITLKQGLLGKKYRQAWKAAKVAFDACEEGSAEYEAFATALKEERCLRFVDETGKYEIIEASEVNESDIVITGAEADVKQVKVRISGKDFTPRVIEPSFGVGRILHCLLEQAFWTREESGERPVLSIPATVAPQKVGILPLVNDQNLITFCEEIRHGFRKYDVPCYVGGANAAIGRLYARADAIGVPYCITVERRTEEDGMVTIRERDSAKQVYVPKDEVVRTVNRLLKGKISFDDIKGEVVEQ